MTPVLGGLEEQGFTPFEVHHDEPHLTAAEMALRSSFEWWYFDLQTADGVSMVVLFSRKNPVFSASRPSIYVEYADAGGQRQKVHNQPSGSFAWSGSGAAREMRIGRNTLRLTGDTPDVLVYEMSLALPWITASLRFKPVHRGFLPSPTGEYFTHRGEPARRSCVSFSAPMMHIKGTVSVHGQSRVVTGRGYHDHPWGTQQLIYTHGQWNWARISDDRRGIMFADVKPQPDYDGRLRFFYEGQFASFTPRIADDLAVQESDWQKLSWHGIRCPHTLGVTAGGESLTLSYQSTLLDTPIYNRSKVQWGPDAGSARAGGWVEYFRLQAWARTLVFIGARVVCFFLRPFPFIGR